MNQSVSLALGRRQGIVAEESDDGGYVLEVGLRQVVLPIADAGYVHPELLGDLALQQLQRESIVLLDSGD
jgi:hypothetical protein